MSDNHAAMCVYCGEAVIYDTREVTDMAAAHAKIVEHDQQCPRNPLVARIAELEKALEPFAEYFNRHEALLPLGTESVAVTLRHLRRAAALLKEKD